MSTVTSSAKSSVSSNRHVWTAAKGGGIAFVGLILEYILRFALGIIITRQLGSRMYGLYVLSESGLEIITTLALLGLSPAMVRYVSLFNSQDDANGVWGTIQAGSVLVGAASIVLGVAMFFGAELMAKYWFDEPDLTLMLKVASISIPFLAASKLFVAILNGFKDMRSATMVLQVATPLIKLALIVAMIFTGLNALKVITARAVVIVLGFVGLVYYLNKRFSLLRPLRSGRWDVRELFRFSVPMYGGNLISAFGGNIQTLLLGSVGTIVSAGVFTAARQVNLVGRMFHSSIVSISMPIVSELHGRNQREQLGRFYQTMTKWTFTLNLPLFLIILLFSKPILSIFGKSFVEGATALQILAWADLFVAGTGICGVILNMTGHTIFNLGNSIVLSVLTITLNALLIPRWGILGAAVATMGSTALMNVARLVEVFIMFRILPYNTSFFKPIAAGVVAAGAGVVIRQMLHTDATLIYALANMVLLLLVYTAVLLVLGFSPEDQVVINRLYTSVKNKLPNGAKGRLTS